MLTGSAASVRQKLSTENVMNGFMKIIPIWTQKRCAGSAVSLKILMNLISAVQARTDLKDTVVNAKICKEIKGNKWKCG